MLARLDQSPLASHGTWTGKFAVHVLGDVSEEQVWRVLRRYNMPPQRRRSWCTSTYPDFTRKTADIVGLCLSCPELLGFGSGREAVHPSFGAGSGVSLPAQREGSHRLQPSLHATRDTSIDAGGLWLTAEFVSNVLSAPRNTVSVV